MQIRGKSHPVQDLIQELREIFLSLGFDEVENPIFIPEEDVYKQYGKEAAVVLDRCYYLAVLPRPDIGIKKDHIAEIRKISPKIDVEKLKTIFREYKEGKLEADDLVERLVIEFNISRKDAIKVLDLFPEF
ncbi:MAG TPA: O-phosphoserine--tRNA ligase, partial [Candidatus Altiarchaeales archaeon]|nr:O-phosphoserine--tRNA ligase [Candidatus Altiarchaeales archaeon]